MFNVLRAHREKKDGGFSLIELMIVVLIIAILIAIAIPTFLGARTKSQDRAAQVNLRQALLTAKSYYTDKETYVPVTVDDGTAAGSYQALEPSLTFNGAIANASDTVLGYSASASTVLFAYQSKSTTWFCISDNVSGPGTVFGTSTAAAHPWGGATPAECTGGW